MAAAVKMSSSRSLAFIFLLIFLTGCKVVVPAVKGGSVESVSGKYSCESGKRCVYNITNTNFNEEFVAVADPGYEFFAWKTGNAYFCGLSAKPCALTTEDFPGNDSLMGALKSDKKFYLEPLFVPKSTLAYVEDEVRSLVFVFTKEFTIVLSGGTDTAYFGSFDKWILFPNGAMIYDDFNTWGTIEYPAQAQSLKQLSSYFHANRSSQNPTRKVSPVDVAQITQQLSTDCSDPQSISRSWDRLIDETFSILRESDLAAAKGITAPLLATTMVCRESKEKFIDENVKRFAEELGVKTMTWTLLDKVDKLANDAISTIADAVTITVDPRVDCLSSGNIGIASCARDLYGMVVDKENNWIEDEFDTFDNPTIRDEDATITIPGGPDEHECTADTDRLLNKTFKNGVSGTAPFDLRVSVDTNTHCGKGVSSSWILRSNIAPDKTASGLSFAATLRSSGSYDLLHRVKSDGIIIAADTTKVTVNPSASGGGDLAGIWYDSLSQRDDDGTLIAEAYGWLELRGGPDIYQLWIAQRTEYYSEYYYGDKENVNECSDQATVRRVSKGSDLFSIDGCVPGEEDGVETVCNNIGLSLSSSGQILYFDIGGEGDPDNISEMEKVSSYSPYCPR